MIEKDSTQVTSDELYVSISSVLKKQDKQYIMLLILLWSLRIGK